MLVVDASVVLAACASQDGFAELAARELVAPPLMWSEARSALHEMAWRRRIEPEDAETTRARIETCPVSAGRPRRLGEEAREVANELGWAKAYDAEYVALARILGCRLVTMDSRLHGGAARLGFVVGPTEL